MHFNLKCVGWPVRACSTFGEEGPFGEGLAIPIRLAAFPVVGFLFGALLDRLFGCSPWLTSIFLVMGFVAAARDLWIRSQKEGKK